MKARKSGHKERQVAKGEGEPNPLGRGVERPRKLTSEEFRKKERN